MISLSVMVILREDQKIQKPSDYDLIDRFLPDMVDCQDPRYLEATKLYDETSRGVHLIARALTWRRHFLL